MKMNFKLIIFSILIILPIKGFSQLLPQAGSPKFGFQCAHIFFTPSNIEGLKVRPYNPYLALPLKGIELGQLYIEMEAPKPKKHNWHQGANFKIYYNHEVVFQAKIYPVIESIYKGIVINTTTAYSDPSQNVYPNPEFKGRGLATFAYYLIGKYYHDKLDLRLFSDKIDPDSSTSDLFTSDAKKLWDRLIQQGVAGRENLGGYPGYAALKLESLKGEDFKDIETLLNDKDIIINVLPIP